MSTIYITVGHSFVWLRGPYTFRGAAAFRAISGAQSQKNAAGKHDHWSFPVGELQAVRHVCHSLFPWCSIDQQDASASPAAVAPPPPVTGAASITDTARAILSNPASSAAARTIAQGILDAAAAYSAAPAAPPRAPRAPREPLAVKMMVGPAGCKLLFPYLGSAALRTALKAIPVPQGWKKFVEEAPPMPAYWQFPAASAAEVRAACVAAGVALEERAAPVQAAPPRAPEDVAREALGLPLHPAPIDRAEAKKAWRKAAAAAHPDKAAPDAASQAAAQDKAAKINAAWKVLDGLYPEPAIAA